MLKIENVMFWKITMKTKIFDTTKYLMELSNFVDVTRDVNSTCEEKDVTVLLQQKSSKSKIRFADAINKVQSKQAQGRVDVNRAVSVLIHSVNHLSHLFEVHSTDDNDKATLATSVEDIFAPRSVVDEFKVPPPLSMSQVIKLLACKEKVAALLHEHQHHHGSTVLHKHATTATMARSVASNNELYNKIKSSGHQKRSRAKTTELSNSTTKRPSIDHLTQEHKVADQQKVELKTVKENKLVPKVFDQQRNQHPPHRTLKQQSTSTSDSYVFDNSKFCDPFDADTERPNVTCCCCCRSLAISDVERAAVLLDDAIRLRSPFHDMESSLQIKVWEFLGTWWWRHVILFIAVVYSFLLPAYSKPSYNYESGTYFDSRDNQFFCECICLGLLAIDLFLTGYAYGSFAYREHKFFIAAVVITCISVIDMGVTMFYYYDSEFLYFRYVKILHCFYLPYYVPRIRSYMQMTIGAAVALKNVLLLLILWTMVSFVVVVYMSPKGCQFPELKECAPTNNTALLYEHTIVQCGQKFSSTGDDGICGTKLYHNRTGALFAQGEVYAKDARTVLMSLIMVMIGSVNYPDVSLPAISTTSKAMYAPWLMFLLMGVIYILNLVLAVVYIEFTKNYGISYKKRWKKFRETLFRAMILVDNDGTGLLEFDEFSALFHALNKLAFSGRKKYFSSGIGKNGEKNVGNLLMKAFKKVDVDGTGTIDKEEFLEVCNTLLGDSKTPAWIHPSRWDVSLSTLNELKKRVRTSVQHMKQHRSKLLQQHKRHAPKSLRTISSHGSSRDNDNSYNTSRPLRPSHEEKVLNDHIKSMEIKSSNLESSTQRRRSMLFDDWYTRTSICEKIIHGGLYPNLRQYLLNPWFPLGTQWMTLLVIASSTLCIANAWLSLYCSTIDTWHDAQQYIKMLEWIGVSIFISEMIFKMLACGIAGYWNTRWWRFDGSLTIMSLALMAIEYHTDKTISCQNRIADLKEFRSLFTWNILQFMRAFRIMRIWARTSGLRNLANIVFAFTSGPFIHWIGLIVTLMIPFAHVATALWGNKMRWTNPNSPLATSAYMSSGDFTFTSQVGYNGTTTIHSPYARVVNFDDFAFSTISLMMLAFQNQWHVIYEGTFKSFAEDDDATRWFGEAATTAFFILYLLLAVLVVLNLLVSHFLQMYQTTTDEHNGRKQRAFKVFNDMQAVAGSSVSTSHSSVRTYSWIEKLRYFFCSQKCQLTGMWIGPDDYVWMVAPQLGQGYEPIAVDIAISLEIIQPDRNSQLSRFIQKEWVKHRCTNAIDRIRKDAEILLGVDKAHKVANATGKTSEIRKMFKEASKIEQKWLAGHKKSMSGSKMSSLLKGLQTEDITFE
jgi:hypothetical protein